MSAFCHGLALPFRGRCAVCGVWTYEDEDISLHQHRGDARSVFDAVGAIKPEQDVAPPLPLSPKEIQILEQIRAFAIEQRIKVYPCGCELHQNQNRGEA
jgi:hypothetical protein